MKEALSCGCWTKFAGSVVLYGLLIRSSMRSGRRGADQPFPGRARTLLGVRGCCGCSTALLYRRISAGVTMERHLLMQLLAGDNDDVSAAALAALRGGATHDVSDWTVPAEKPAGGYATRLRYWPGFRRSEAVLVHEKGV